MNREDIKPNIKKSRYKVVPSIKDQEKDVANTEDRSFCANSVANKNEIKNTQMYTLPINIAERFGLNTGSLNQNCDNIGFSSSYNTNNEKKSSQREAKDALSNIDDCNVRVHEDVDIQICEIEKEKTENRNTVVNVEKSKNPSYPSGAKNKVTKRLSSNFAIMENDSDLERINFEIPSQAAENEVKTRSSENFKIDEISSLKASSINDNILTNTDVNNSYILNLNENLNQSNSPKSLEKQDNDYAGNKTIEIAEYLKTFLQSVKKNKEIDSNQSVNNICMQQNEPAVIFKRESFDVSASEKCNIALNTDNNYIEETSIEVDKSNSDVCMYSIPKESTFTDTNINNNINNKCIDTSLNESAMLETIHLFDDDVEEVIKHDLNVENETHDVLKKKFSNNFKCINEKNIPKKYFKSYCRNRNKNDVITADSESNFIDNRHSYMDRNEFSTMSTLDNTYSEKNIERNIPMNVSLINSKIDSILKDSCESISQNVSEFLLTQESTILNNSQERNSVNEAHQLHIIGDDDISNDIPVEIFQVIEGRDESGLQLVENEEDKVIADITHEDSLETLSQASYNIDIETSITDFYKEEYTESTEQENSLINESAQPIRNYFDGIEESNADSSSNITSISNIENEQHLGNSELSKSEKVLNETGKRDRPKKHHIKEYSGNELTKCAICSKEMLIRDWPTHNMTFHNCLGWLNGEQPIDLDDKKRVFKLLQQKVKAKKRLKCEKCSTFRMSADGFISHLAMCKKTEQGNKDIVKTVSCSCQCAVCSKEMPLKDWPMHNMTIHNFLGWLNGEKPIDLKNRGHILKLLKEKLKAKKSLKCEKCSVVRMSAEGFFSHLNVCQKTEQEIEDSIKIMCHLCQRTMLPQSMSYHMRETHSDKKREITKLTIENVEIKTKRKAAKQAEESFKKGKFESPNDTTSDRIDVIKTLIKKIPDNEIPALLKTSKKSRKYNKQKNEQLDMNNSQDSEAEKSISIVLNMYTCTICDYMDRFKYNTTKHISEMHSQHIDNLMKKKVSSNEDAPNSGNSSNMDDDDDDYNDNNMNDQDISDSNSDDSEEKLKFRQGVPAFSTIKKNIKSHNFHVDCAKTFVEKNYSNKIIFEELDCNIYQAIDESDIMKFLPENQVSCKIAHVSLNDPKKDDKIQWKKYNLFETQLSGGALTLWCGGPVWSISWVPEQHDNQYLAVAVDRKMDERYFYNKVYEHNNLIQIWDVGFLSNEKKCQSNAEIVYSIAHNHGVIWDMEWCPSGCNDYSLFNQSDTNNVCHQKNSLIRLGLLSVACSNGKAYIYAMCHPSSLTQCKSKIYCTKPCVELGFHKNIETTDNFIFQATKISWSKHKNHEVIAVGYSNGLVALFDINTKSPLLRNKREQTVYLYPYFVFRPYTDLINGLVIILKYSENSTNQDVLLGISSSQGCGIWNGINCLINKKGRYSYIFSSFPWPQILTISDGLLSHKSSNSNMTGLTVLSTNYVENTDFAISGPGVIPICGVGDTNIYNNKILTASYSGDVVLFPVRSPYFSSSKEKFLNNKFIFSCARAVNLCEELSQVLNKNTFTEGTNKPISKDSVIKNETCDTFSYEEVVQKYGLLFIDAHSKSKKLENAGIQTCPPNRWPIQSILCAKINPSLQANNFYAFGGRAGYVRILNPSFDDCK